MPRKRDTSWIQDYFFLIVPQPFEDELLSSWLTRVAIKHKRKLSIFLSLYVKNYDEIFEIPFEKSISMKEMYKNICPYVLANIENKEINESFINPIVNHNKMRL